VADAAPGDPVALRGTLAWPPTLTNDPFAVVRTDDGRFFYADLTGAERGGAIPAGGRLSLLGGEGARPHEVVAVAIGPGDSVLSALPAEPSASPVTEATPGAAAVTPTPSRPADTRLPERIEGTLESVVDRTITIRSGGRAIKVDVSKLGSNVLQGVKAGDPVTVFAIGEPNRPLTAVGFVHTSARPR
jgi:hypothetical protein